MGPNGTVSLTLLRDFFSAFLSLASLAAVRSVSLRSASAPARSRSRAAALPASDSRSARVLCKRSAMFCSASCFSARSWTKTKSEYILASQQAAGQKQSLSISLLLSKELDRNKIWEYPCFSARSWTETRSVYILASQQEAEQKQSLSISLPLCKELDHTITLVYPCLSERS